MERQQPEQNQSMHVNEAVQEGTWPLGGHPEATPVGQVFVLVATSDEAAAQTIAEHLAASGHRVECTTSLEGISRASSSAGLLPRTEERGWGSRAGGF